MRGILLAFEGIDGSGKATQVGLLSEHLQAKGASFAQFSFPDYGGPLSGAIRHALKCSDFEPSALQLLLSAERVRHRPALQQCLLSGKLALLDRYKSSAYVYAIARGLPGAWALSLESVLPEPDITILFDLPVELSLLRTGGSDLLEQDVALLSRCREEYLAVAQRQPNWIILDATENREALHKTLLHFLTKRLPPQWQGVFSEMNASHRAQ